MSSYHFILASMKNNKLYWIEDSRIGGILVKRSLSFQCERISLKAEGKEVFREPWKKQAELAYRGRKGNCASLSNGCSWRVVIRTTGTQR